VAFRNATDTGIYTYNLLPETEIYQKNTATQVVCADELRQVLLAFNCLQQATATLVLNMLHQHRPSEKFDEVWKAEYDDSLGNEFYISYLNPIFDGMPFGFVSWVSEKGDKKRGNVKYFSATLTKCHVLSLHLVPVPSIPGHPVWSDYSAAVWRASYGFEPRKRLPLSA
jgi:hypothetical protein